MNTKEIAEAREALKGLGPTDFTRELPSKLVLVRTLFALRDLVTHLLDKEGTR